MSTTRNQIAMVMDLNKCLGCQTCTLACKKQWTDHSGMQHMYWNNVETRPGAGYPKNWEKMGGGFTAAGVQPGTLPALPEYGHALEYGYEGRLFQGAKQEVRPDKYPDYTPNWDEDVGAMDKGENHYFYLPRICNHCANPACLKACTRGAIYKRDEDGIVLVDQARCRGYRDCVRACPYKKAFYNELTKASQKCIFCYPRLEKGTANACARQCPGRLRFIGLLHDKESPIHKLVKDYKVALPLHPEYRTGPNVYYVPPFGPPRRGNYGKSLLFEPRIPVEYLVSLFGPTVVGVLEKLEAELARVRKGEKSEVLDLLIGRNERVRYRLPAMAPL